MSTPEKARQSATEQRQRQHLRQQSMLERSESETAKKDDVEIQEETRESLARHRQKDQHRADTMKHRSEEEIDSNE